MALTRITKGVIKPNENYDTHNINSTGIVTAIGLDVNGNGDISGNLNVGGVLTYEDVTSIDSVGVITARDGIHIGAGVSAVGVGTFSGLDISGDIDVDGHTNLDNISVAGVSTFVGNVRIGDNASVSTSNTGDDLVVGNLTSGHGITIVSGQANGNLNFADSGSGNAGAISYNHSNNTMRFRVAGSEKLRITSTGRVGIGTDNVSAPLHIFDTSDAVIRLESSDNGAVYHTYHRDNAGTKTRIGYMGFGGTGGTLNIANEVPNGNIFFQTTPSGSSAGAEETAFRIHPDKKAEVYGDLQIADKITHTSDTNTAIRFPANDTVTVETAGGERFRITSTGTIGIGGTTIPGALLDLSSGQPGILFSETDVSANNGKWLNQANASELYWQAQTDAHSGGGNLFKMTRSNEQIQSFEGQQSGVTWFTIRNSDKTVGIGTDNPDRKLHVGGSFIRVDDGYGLDTSGSTEKVVLDNGYISLTTNSIERLRINSNGRLLIGSDTERNVGGGSNKGQLQIEGTSGNTSAITLIRNQTNTGGPFIRFGKTRSNSDGGVTSVNNSDHLGSITFSGADGTDLNNATALIRAIVNGSVSGNTIPTDLIFETSATDSGSRVERLRIHSDGKIGIGLAGATPDGLLEVYNSSTGGNTVLKIHNDKTGDAANITLEGKRTSDNDTGQVLFRNNNYGVAGIFANAGGSGNHDGGYLKFFTSEVGSGNVLSERLRILSGGGITVQQGNNHYPTTFIGGSTGGRNFVSVKAGNTTSGHNSGFKLYHSDGGGVLSMFINHDDEHGNIMNEHQGGDIIFWTKESSSATKKLRITSDGKLCIAHDDLNSGKLQVSTDSSDAIDISSYSTSANNGGRLTFYRSKNASIGSNTIVADDDSLGRIDFRGYNSNGNSNNLGATIEARVDGSVNSTTDMPTAISFKTSADDSASPGERLRIMPDGKIIMGYVSNTSGSSNSALHIEAAGMNVESQYDTDDLAGAPPHLTLSGQSTRVRMDMGTLTVAPYAGWIQARFDNNPFGTSGANDGIEPLLLNPVGGALGINVHDGDALYNIGAGSASSIGGVVIRAGRANSTTVNNASTAIKIFPGEVRAYSGSGGTGEQNQGTKYGGIAWNVLDPHNGGWGATHTGHHCWMGMSLHSTPAQEKSNWQVQMNSTAVAGSYATNVAIQANPEGYITKPSTPSFFAYGISGSTFDNGTMTGGDVSSVGHNVGSHYDTSTGIFTAPISGRYAVGCGVLVHTSTGRLEGSISKNNSVNLVSFNGTGSTYDGPNAHVIVQLAKNDNLRVIKQSGNAYNPSHPNNYFYAYLVG